MIAIWFRDGRIVAMVKGITILCLKIFQKSDLRSVRRRLQEVTCIPSWKAERAAALTRQELCAVVTGHALHAEMF